ncbi:hypothetical protein FEDK69T_31550 [Flavobacterium enshiense DK69]|nr:hypothetical protein FEDK69T_31550 [Flavobacterium enshiense DK69]
MPSFFFFFVLISELFQLKNYQVFKLLSKNVIQCGRGLERVSNFGAG